MCQFCHQHGEGKKWYHNSANYAEDLLNDLERRSYIREFVHDVAGNKAQEMERTFQKSIRLPRWLREWAYGFYERKYRRDHFGQVLPKEDLKEVFRLASSIVRLPCVCRKSTSGVNDARYCLGLTLNLEECLDIRDAFLEAFRFGPHVDPFEKLTEHEAWELTEKFEKEGLVHTIWTFKTPFIGAVCNCDRADCLAMKAYQYEFRLFFRGEYVAEIDPERCVGCKACMEACQFGALIYSAHRCKVSVDPLRCYGCGLCRTYCETNAISLITRSSHPIAARLW